MAKEEEAASRPVRQKAQRVKPKAPAPKAPAWPPPADDASSPLFSLSGMYAALKKAVNDEDEGYQREDQVLWQPQDRQTEPQPSSTRRMAPLSVALPSLSALKANPQSPLSASQSLSHDATFITQSCPIRDFDTAKAKAQVNATNGTQPVRRRTAVHTEASAVTGAKQDSKQTAQTEIRLVANAPSLPLAGRAVHPLFLAGTLLHGLPSLPSAAITGEKLRRRAQQAAVPEPPVGWSTTEFVNNCVRPALGPTRICYVQALACGAAEVDWAPNGHFTSDLRSPVTHTTSVKKHTGTQPQSSATVTQGSSKAPVQRGSDHVSQTAQREGSLAAGEQPRTALSIPTSASLTQDQGPLELTLPEDLSGRLAYGPVTYYVSHAWQQSYEDLVTAILHHYSRLPEVVRTGGTQFVPAYYWVDVFAVAQYERPCPELKHHPDKALTGVIAAPTCQGVLLAAQPWAQPVTLSRAWCLYEVNLARVLGRELQVLLMEEQPGPEGHSPRLPLSRLSGVTAASVGLGGTAAAGSGMASLGSGSGASGLRNARGALAGNTRVIETVDSALSALDLTHMSTRLKADMNFILTQAGKELGGVLGFNLALRAYLRPHILAALLSALLRSPEPRIWGAAAALIRAGAFLQWGAPSFVVDVNSPAGSADNAAAFLGLALRTRAPRGASAALFSTTYPTTSHHSTDTNTDTTATHTVYNPIHELVFLPPENSPQSQQDASMASSQPTNDNQSASTSTSRLGLGSSVGSTSRQYRHGSTGSTSVYARSESSRDRVANSNDTRVTSVSSHLSGGQFGRRVSQLGSGGEGGGLVGQQGQQGSRPGSRCASPRQLIDGGVVMRSPRGPAPQQAVQTEVSSSRHTHAHSVIDGGVVMRSPRGRTVQQVSPTEDAITRSLARMKSNACTMSRGRHNSMSGNETIQAGPIVEDTQAVPQQLSLNGVATLCPALVGNTCLTTLTLSGHPLGCEGTLAIASALCRKPCALKHLRLRGCSIGREGALALGKLLGASQSCCLTELDVGSNPDMGPKGAVSLASGLPHAHTLTHLYLDHCSIDSPAAAAIATALRDQLDSIKTDPLQQTVTATQTTTTALTPGQPTQAMVPPRRSMGGNGAALAPVGGLTVLDLSHNRIGPDAADSLSALLSHPTCALKDVTLSHNCLETQGALAIAHALQVNQSVQVLRMRDNQLALEVGAALGMALSGYLPVGVRNPKTYHSTLGPVPWPTGHPPTNELTTNRHPHSSLSETDSEIDYGGHTYDQGGCVCVGGDGDSGLGPPRLVAGLHGAGGTGVADRWRVQARAVPCAVRVLDLGDNPFLGDVGVELLAQGLSQAQGRCALTELLLDNTGCGEHGAEALARALAQHGGESRGSMRPTAATIDASTPPTQRHMQRRATNAAASTSTLPATGVSVLDLSHNPLRSQGATALAALVPAASHLRTLRLHSCKIGAGGRLALLTALQLSGNSTLTTLDMSGNGVHPAEYVPKPMHFVTNDRPIPEQRGVGEATLASGQKSVVGNGGKAGESGGGKVQTAGSLLASAHQYSRAEDSLLWMGAAMQSTTPSHKASHPAGTVVAQPSTTGTTAQQGVGQGGLGGEESDTEADIDHRVPARGGLSKLEAALAQSLTIARQLQTMRPGLSIQF